MRKKICVVLAVVLATIGLSRFSLAEENGAARAEVKQGMYLVGEFYQKPSGFFSLDSNRLSMHITVVCDPVNGNLIYSSHDGGGMVVVHQPDACKPR